LIDEWLHADALFSEHAAMLSVITAAVPFCTWPTTCWVKPWFCDSLERQELSGTHLAHYELEIVIIITIFVVIIIIIVITIIYIMTIIIIIIIGIIYSAMLPGETHAGAVMESRHACPTAVLTQSQVHKVWFSVQAESKLN